MKSFTRDFARDGVVTKIKNVSLCGIQFFRLRPKKWLDDEVVTAFAVQINTRNLSYRRFIQAHANAQESVKQDRVPSRKKQLRLRGPPRPRVYMFNSFFLHKVLQPPYDYERVRKWRRRACKDASVLEYSLLLFPFNEDNSHWALAVIDVRGRRFLIYIDSLGTPESHGIIPALRQWLKDELRETEGAAVVDKFDVDSWKSVNNPFRLRQTDGSSCGIFMLYTAYFLELGKAPAFSQEDIRIIRKRTALFLKRGALPDNG